MKIIRNNILPPGRNFSAINLFGIFFIKRNVLVDRQFITHETIHTLQMKELLYIPFYIIYVIEWIVRLFQNRGDSFKAYLSISFEREAYDNDFNPDYPAQRKRFAQWRK